MKIITEVISPSAEVSKEEICNRMIHVNDFHIFSRPYSLDDMVNFLEKCHANVLLETSEAILQKKNKRKISKKYSERVLALRDFRSEKGS